MQQLNLFEKQLESVTTAPSLFPKAIIKKIIEALLFSSSNPISIHKIREIISDTFTIETKELLLIIKEMKEEYENDHRALQLEEIAHGFTLRTKAEMAPFVERLHQRKEDKLSKASLEVLAIIAYKQPITKGGIEALRGVDCSGPLYSLVDRELVEVVGRLEMPGRPAQYGITKKFLQHFGLKEIKELQSLSIHKDN